MEPAVQFNSDKSDLRSPRTVAWFSFFPVEWLTDSPIEVQSLPKQHPASWQRVLLDSLQELVPDLNVHVLVLRRHFSKSCSFQRRNVTFHLIRTPRGTRATSLYWVDTFLISRQLSKIRPDLIHAWGSDQGAALVASRLAYPSIVTIQGLYSWFAQIGRATIHERLSAWVERRSLPRAQCVTTESRFSVEYVNRHFRPRQVLQIEHAPAGIFREIQRSPVIGPLRFVYVGRFERRKGADMLFEALNQLLGELDFELVFVGPGDSPNERLFHELRRNIPSALWKRVVMKFDLTASDVAAELRVATMMIYPTRVDVSPNTVKEAVVARLPVVASRVGGIPDYVVPGKNGLLFQAGDLAGCVQTIREACRHPLFSRGLVDDAVAGQMRDYLSPKTMARQFWNAYQDVYRASK
jgi:glycosyltransferase involved in cell wall biosynthesis